MRVDFSNRGIKKLDSKLLDQYLEEIKSSTPEIRQALAENGEDETNFDLREFVQILILDNNGIIKLENLEKFVELKRLSLANNRLVEIKHITKLANLEYVNLVNNSLTSLDSFKDLKRLIWLNVSGNQIKSLDSLKHNTELRYIDASDNSISNLSDLSQLKELTTLKVNGNEIKTLKMVPKYLPTSIKELNLAQNEISDLNEISYIVGLNELENLSIENNPCVAYLSMNTENSFDYRPFVINWCLGLVTLDGYSITRKEYLKAEWLYSQGKGRHFKPGDSDQLVEYLAKQCPYTHESFKEEARLSKVLEKQKEYISDVVRSPRVDHKQETNIEIPISPSKSKYSLPSSPSKHHNLNSETESTGGDFSSKTNLMNVNFSSTDSMNTLDKEGRVLPVFRISSNVSPKIETQSFVVHSEVSTDPENKADAENTDSDRPFKTDNQNMSSPDQPRTPQQYKDYDNRPIKPLDQNLLYKQLSEYSEMSSEEYEQMKNRAIRFRSKTAESTVATSQTVPSRPTKPYLLANKSNTKPVSNKNLAELTPVASQHQLDDQQQNRLNRIKKRSKTQDNLTIKKNLESASSKAITPAKRTTTTTTNSTASVAKAASNATPKIYNKNVVTSKRIVAKKSVKNSPKPSSNLSLLAPTSNKKDSDEEQVLKQAANLLMKRSISLRSSTENNESGLADVIAKHYQKQKEVAEFLSNNNKPEIPSSLSKSPLKDYAEPEFQNKIKQQREEQRLQRENKFKEIKNQFIKKYTLEKESVDFESSYYNRVIPMPKVLTFEDRCAIKIQAAWRGYWLRKTRFVKPKVQMIKFKKMELQVKAMKQTLDEIKQEHLKFAELSKSSYAELVGQLSSFMSNHIAINSTNKSIDINQIKSKITPVNFDESQSRSDEIKQKYTQLEEKYKQLQIKLDFSLKTQTELQQKYLNVLDQLDNVKLAKAAPVETKVEQPPTRPPLLLEQTKPSEPKLEMYPPLRVRLQKLNEKSVALKWNHNPKNFLIALSGYNIYINDELCAELKAEDQIASINGLQEEGEYRIYVKSVCGQQESECSNVVVTRVKRKQKKGADESTANETKDKLKSSFNSELEHSAKEKDESMEKALNHIRSSFSTQSEFKDTVTIEEQDGSLLKQTDNSITDSLTSTRKSEKGAFSLPAPSTHELNTTASKHSSPHSFIENYEKLKSQLKRSSSSFSSKTSFQAPLTMPFTNLSNNSNQITTSNKLGNQSGSFSLVDQLPPAPNMSPLKKKVLEEALNKDLSSYMLKKNKSGHTRQPSNESVHSSPSMTLAELLNSAKYSNTEPSSLMLRTGSTSDRNSFLRQSLSLNESDEFN